MNSYITAKTKEEYNKQLWDMIVDDFINSAKCEKNSLLNNFSKDELMQFVNRQIAKRNREIIYGQT